MAGGALVGARKRSQIRKRAVCPLDYVINEGIRAKRVNKRIGVWVIGVCNRSLRCANRRTAVVYVGGGFNEGHSRPNSGRLIQLLVLRLGFLQDGDVKGNVFEREVRQITSAVRTSAESKEMTLAYFALVNNTASL
jgi:hypothetical protein